jgi:hypothetical protein
MTTTEARKLVQDSLIDAFPNLRYVSATKQDVWSAQSGEYEAYSICLQPGMNGNECQTFFGDSLEACVKACVYYEKPTPNDE